MHLHRLLVVPLYVWEEFIFYGHFLPAKRWRVPRTNCPTLGPKPFTEDP